MKKRIMGLFLAVLLGLSVFMPSALAIDAGQSRVTIGANLDEAQRAQIYKDFGIEEGDVTELKVTNAEERAYLEGLVSENKIGSVALSCVYIKTLDEGEGLHITTNNINWCSKEMYINALTTAGISDAEVKISAPFEVSGTAALTGLYKAYEDITGEQLDMTAKSVAAEEIVITGNLAEMLGDVDATELVNQLKLILEQTKGMSDDEVRSEIKTVAANINVQVTDAQIEQLLQLCRSLEKLDASELAEKVNSITKTIESANKVEKTVSKVVEDVKTFFASVGTFFSKLFTKK
ncbi:MAG: DUF1002 domain-containing protein [Bacillota bacterium]